jgi:hypothetical protein
MDAEQAKIWKAGHEAANAHLLEEQRQRTPAERFALLEKMQADRTNILALRSRPDSVEFHLRWNVLRERWLARQV